MNDLLEIFRATKKRLAELDILIATEDSRIQTDIINRQMGDGSGYWKQRHEYRLQRRACLSLIEAITELMESK